MSEHTPGPWAAMRAARPSDGGWDWGIFAAVNESTTKCIAEAFEVVDHGIKTPAEANARLIAEAPGMLKALTAASHALKSYAFGNGAPDLAKSTAEFIDAVIAKAEGRS